MKEARDKELAFFRQHPAYTSSKNVGTGFLSVKLSNHLISSIRKQLPVITHSINEGIIGLEKELEAMGGAQVCCQARSAGPCCGQRPASVSQPAVTICGVTLKAMPLPQCGAATVMLCAAGSTLTVVCCRPRRGAACCTWSCSCVGSSRTPLPSALTAARAAARSSCRCAAGHAPQELAGCQG